MYSFCLIESLKYFSWKQIFIRQKTSIFVVMIDYITVERIKNAAQIYDVVSDFVTLRKRGVNYVGLCPFHEDKTPSFYVSPSKNICKCFACQEGGTPIQFIQKHENLSYAEALKFLAKKYGIEVKETELTDEQKQVHNDKESMFILNEFAQKTFTHNLFDTEEGAAIGLSYFKERGFREDIIRKFQLGYSLDEWDAFYKEATKSNYKKEFLEKTGLCIGRDNGSVIDRFRGRVMFPVHTLSGKVVAFGGRTLKKEEKAKYVNSPESDIYHKSNELYGLYFARQAMVKQDKCYLVEGYTDVLSMHQAGVENVVASSGTALTQGQIRLIYRFTKNITVLYDGDSAGIKAALRGIDLLLEYGLNIKIVLLPDGEDPDSFSRKQNASSFVEYLHNNETDFIQFKVRLLMKDAENDPVKKAAMINDIVDTIALIPEEITRLVYVKECSKILDLEERLLARNVAMKRNETILQKKKTLYPATVDSNEGYNEVLPPETGSSMPSSNTKAVTYNKFEKYERSILYYIVRYGQEVIFFQQDQESNEEFPVTVAEYVYQELLLDDIVFSQPYYQQILQECCEKLSQEGFVSESYFINHVVPEISEIAVDLSTDKYIESKLYQKIQQTEDKKSKLLEQVPYEILNYKDAILKHKMEELNKKIKEAENNKDIEAVGVLVKELTELWQESKKQLAQHLRERIITKI